jgi:4-hydroxy-tetrahydrodipicolinate synthase
MFRGVIPPLVTPLSDRDTLDHAGLSRLVKHVLAGGVHGLFILGTTGEAPSLSYRLRSELINRVCELANGRVPVLVGITDTAFVESVKLAHIAKDAGAKAVVLSTPYYFPAGQTELIGYVERISRELPLPLVLRHALAAQQIPPFAFLVRGEAQAPGVAAVMKAFHHRRLA